jgi:multiple sugar transport system permease protein
MENIKTKRNLKIKEIKLIKDITTHVILILTSIIMLYPLVWMLSSSLKYSNFDVTGEGVTLFHQLRFSNYKAIFTYIDNPGLFEGFKNSVIVVIPSLLVGSYVSTIAAYAFAKINFKYKNIVFLLLLSVLMIPFPIIMIPQYTMFAKMNWYNTLLPLIIPKMFGNVLMVFFIKQYLVNIPNDLIESGKVDGANHFIIFHSLIIPLIWPAIAAQMILWFMGIWNDYLAPQIFAGNAQTLPVVISRFMSPTSTFSKTQLNMAASVFAMMPVLIIFTIFQKKIVASVAFSGMKE